MKVAVQVSQELLIPVVATIHGLYYSPRKLRGLLEWCPYVIAVSEPVVGWLSSRVDYPLRRIVMIPNGVETDIYTPASPNNSFHEGLELREDEKLLVLVSRLAWTKTHKIKLAVIGGGASAPLIHAAASLANRMSRQNLVHVLGWRLNTAECYQAADVVIGTARVALEAMSCQRPVIAAGNASYFGILKPENLTTAWKVYFGDHKWYKPVTISQLSEDIKTILNNERQSLEIARQTKHWVTENFAITKIAAKTKEFYESVLAMGSIQTNNHEQMLSRPVKKIEEVEKEQQVVISEPKNNAQDMFLAKKPLVSVAIPAYNTAEYLKECLDSIANQTYRPLEIVLVNDGSTDDTEIVALEWWEELAEKDNLSFIYQKQARNTGNAAAQSTAYHLSSGEYIANQDSDDISHPKRIEIEMLFLLANPDYSMVGCNFNSFKDTLENQQRSYMLVYGYGQIVNTYHNGGHCVCFGTLLFNRSVYQRVGGLTAFLKGAEDYEWIARGINQSFYIDNLKEVLYFYRQHDRQRARLNRELRRKLETLGRSNYSLGLEGD